MSRPPRLEYVLRHPVTGADLLGHALPHPHKSNWRVGGFTPGASAGGVVGSFTIPLFGEREPRFADALADYQKLVYNARVEGYLGRPYAGQPVVSGNLRNLQVDDHGWALSGVDSLVALEKTVCAPGETFNGRTDQLARFALNAEANYWVDDFLAGFSGYTTYAPGGGAWSAGTDEGLPCAFVVAGGGIEGRAFLTPALPAAAWATTWRLDTYVHLSGLALLSHGLSDNYSRLRIPYGGSVVAGAYHGYWLELGFGKNSATDPNFWFSLNTQSTNSGFNFGLSGAPVVGGFAPWGFLVMPGTTTDLRLWITLVGVVSGGNTVVRTYLGGVDVNAPATLTGLVSGAVGVGMETDSNLGVVASCGFLMHNARTQAFQAGTPFATGATSISQVVGGSTMLDLLNASATIEGARLRKTPGAGLNQDKIEWGTFEDVSAGIRFQRRSGTLHRASLVAGEQSAASVVLVGGAPSPGTGNGGQLLWPNAAAVRSMGVLVDQEPQLAVADFRGLRGAAAGLAAVKGNPLQAKEIQVPWKPEWFALAGAANGWREQSLVSIDDPRKNVISRTARVLGWTLDETKDFQLLALDQNAVGGLGQFEKVASAVELLVSRAPGRSQSIVGGSVLDYSQGSPNLVPYGGVPQSVTTHAVPAWNNAGNLRVRFQLPSFASALQKAVVSFTTGAGMAGVHLFVDGADVTVAQGGPWGVGDFGEFDVTSVLSGAAGFHEFQLDATAGGTAVLSIWVYVHVRPI